LTYIGLAWIQSMLGRSSSEARFYWNHQRSQSPIGALSWVCSLVKLNINSSVVLLRTSEKIEQNFRVFDRS